MKKKMMAAFLIASFALSGAVGCQKDVSVQTEPVQEEQIQEESQDETQEEQIQEETEGVTLEEQVQEETQDVTVKEQIQEEPQDEIQEEPQEEQTPVEEDRADALDKYMTSIIEQSDSIKYYLEHEAMTQYDLNMKSKELYDLWDGVLNELWGKLKEHLSEDDFSELLAEQRIWITEKEKAAEEAGKEYEGGSMYPLIVNSEAARITEERVYDFYELLK